MDPVLDPPAQTWSTRFDAAVTELKSGMNGLRGALSAVESATADVENAKAAVIAAEDNEAGAKADLDASKPPIIDSLDGVVGLIEEMKVTLAG